MSRGAHLRALYRQRRPSDAYVMIDCPRCEEPMVVYVVDGQFDHIHEGCGSGCRSQYSPNEWDRLSAVAQAAADDDREPDGDDCDD